MSNYLTNEQVLQLNEKHGWFEFGDAQSDVSKAFAQDAIAMYLAATEAAKATGTALQPMTMSYVQNVPDQCDRITWRGAYYHLKEGAEEARQPAPALPVKRWEDRANDAIAAGASIDHFNGFRDAEIADLRAALAATAAPVLSDEQIDALWRERYDASGEEWDADDFRIFARNAILAATRSQP